MSASDVALVLEAAGENAPELKGFLAAFAPGTDERLAAEFLVAGMSVGDAASLSASELRENLEYAFAARWAMPWGRAVPFSMFLRDVLPHRAGSEVFRPWRERFFTDLAPRVQDCASMAEAALRVNLWCLEQAIYEGTNGYPLAPTAVAGRGLGRCGELSKLFVCAARSVGLPARTVHVPMWQHTESNHGWVEVWTGDGWHFLGASEPEPELDRGWFAPHLGKAPLVLALDYGPPEGEAGPQPPDKRGATVVNRTADYAPTGTLRLEVRGAEGPLAGAEVVLSVFNSGFMRPIARLRMDADGARELPMGCGTYLAVTRSGGGEDWGLARVRPGEDAVLALDAARRRLPEGQLELEFCPGELPPFEGAGRGGYAMPGAEFAARHQAVEEARVARLSAQQREAVAALDALGQDAACPREVALAALGAAGANWPEVLRVLKAIPERDRDEYCAFLGAQEAKDLTLMRSPWLLSGVRLSLAARAVRPGDAPMGDRLRDDVMGWRLGGGPPGNWRPQYMHRFMGYYHMPPSEAAAVVGTWAGRLPVVPGGYFRHEMTPLEILRAGHVSRAEERKVAAGAALRALGIPVRDSDWRYLADGRWLPIPVATREEYDAAEEGREPVLPPPPPDPGEPVIIPLKALVPDYDPAAPGEPPPACFREFAVCRMDETGTFRPIDPDRPEQGGRERTITLYPGQYWLSVGSRDVSGRAVVHLRPFRAEDMGPR